MAKDYTDSELLLCGYSFHLIWRDILYAVSCRQDNNIPQPLPYYGALFEMKKQQLMLDLLWKFDPATLQPHTGILLIVSSPYVS